MAKQQIPKSLYFPFSVQFIPNSSANIQQIDAAMKCEKIAVERLWTMFF